MTSDNKSWFDIMANEDEKHTANNLVSATMEARKRTGKMIATRVKMGRIQIVEIEYKEDETIETPLTEYLEGPKVISELNKLGK